MPVRKLLPILLPIFLLLLSVGVVVAQPPTFQASYRGTSVDGTNTVVVAAVPATVGHTLVAMFQLGDDSPTRPAPAATPCADDAGNTWTTAIAYQPTADQPNGQLSYIVIAVAKITNGNASENVTCTRSNGNWGFGVTGHVIVADYSGTPDANPIDAVPAGTTTAPFGTPTSGTFTTTVANETFILVVASGSSAAAISSANGYTAQDTSLGYIQFADQGFTSVQSSVTASVTQATFYDTAVVGVGLKGVNSGPSSPVVTTTTASSITSTSAVSGGTVTSNGGASVTAEGVCWGTTANPSLGGACSSDGTATPFTSTLSPLTPSTTYHYRAYATNSVGTGYGADLTFTTSAPPASPPTVTTTAASSITITTATGGGNVTADGGGTVTAVGVCWGTAPNPSVGGNCTSDTTGTVPFSFTSSITGLSASTTYHYRAFATNSAGTAYGSDIPFTSAPGTWSNLHTLDVGSGPNIFFSGIGLDFTGATVTGLSQGTGVPLTLTRTSGTVLTMGPTCASATPCNVEFGNILRTFIASMPVTLSGTGTGDAFFSADPNGNIDVASSTLTLACSGTCSVSSGSTYVTGTKILYTWHATGGVWDATGTDVRAALSLYAVELDPINQPPLALAYEANGTQKISWDATRGFATIYTQITEVTVSGLPTCNSGAAGTFRAVSDATAPTYLGTLTGGGTVHVPVYCNGTNWVSH